MNQFDPSIYYVPIVPDWRPEHASPMQGFAPSLCRNSWVFNVVSILPASIFDLTPEGHEIYLARRMSGQYPIRIHPQSPRAARAFPPPPFSPFNVYLLPEEEELQNYAEWLKKCLVPPVIVAKSGGDLSYKDLTIDGLKTAFLKIIENIPEDIDPNSIKFLEKTLRSWAPLPERKLGFQLKGHGSVLPNIAALTAAGFTDLLSGPFDDHQSNWKPYVEQIIRTAHTILDERDLVGERDMQRIYRTSPDVNVYAPAIYPHFFKAPIRADIPANIKRNIRLTREILRTQSGYSYELNTEARQQTLFSVNDQGEIETRKNPIMLTRAGEVNFGTSVMCALAASEFSVVLRMPNDINRTSGAIRHFAEHHRSKSPKTRKRLLAFREVQNRLDAAFPTDFKDILRRSKSGIRVVSDAHLEWLDLDGLPLMLRKTCSRVPVTPGNLFVSKIGAQDTIQLSPTDLQKVLVISALKPDDPIAGIFDTAFEIFGKRWEGKLDITTNVVGSEKELVNAINTFDGHMLLFDGHGIHEKDGPGKLLLQGEAIDVWDLRPKLSRIPPIVILSACDTHAADRNHATTANGFLSLGARAVLGSVFPIDARAAAVFTARFLYRVADYLSPAIAIYDHGLRWSDVVSGMFRMQILTDFLRALLKSKLIDSNLYTRIHIDGNRAINSNQEDPLGQVLSMLEKLGHDRAMLQRELQFAVANSDIISYLHIGRPETILIDDPDRIAKQLSEFEPRREQVVSVDDPNIQR